jgi:hypothetical protein
MFMNARLAFAALMLAPAFAACVAEPEGPGDASLPDAPGVEAQSLCTANATCSNGSQIWCQGDFVCTSLDGPGGFVNCDGQATSCSPAQSGPLVPIMGGPTTPSGIVTRSGIYTSGYEGWQAFDGTTATLWLSNSYTSSVWVGYEFGGGLSKTVTSYELKYANGSCCQQRGPKNWQLQGSNGSTWVTVDTVSGQTGWYSNPHRTFTVASPGSYKKYRLLVTADNYNNATSPITVVSIAGFQLFGY